ncbi:MAG: prenyltransferase/squalene oxidase repeat-containing protein [Candidatus Hydrogenedentes bacterium]|nr:prenyltransferase/squalene oxidase repeat-containing protein [Candidatus Hydrogenedentota bacterium]
MKYVVTSRLKAYVPRELTKLALVFALLMLPVALPNAQEPETEAPVSAPEPTVTEIEIVHKVMGTTDRALEYLARKQQPDGKWVANNGVDAVTLLAFLGRGHVPGRGPFREVVDRAKDHILSTQREDGYFVSAMGSGRMYGHALATLAMAETYGMDPDPRVEEALRKAVDLIVNVQSPNGGWRYEPTPGDHDLSVTVMQVVALRAANNAEIPVPEETINKAVEYVHSCNHKESGGFGYQPGRGGSPPMSAAGVLSLQLLGKYDDPLITPALEYLKKTPVHWNAQGSSFFFYFHYYAIQAEYQAGGDYWSAWHPRVREVLLANQKADGSWEAPPGSNHEAKIDTVGPDNIYATAMACLVLEIYFHFLPAYQR